MATEKKNKPDFLVGKFLSAKPETAQEPEKAAVPAPLLPETPASTAVEPESVTSDVQAPKDPVARKRKKRRGSPKRARAGEADAAEREDMHFRVDRDLIKPLRLKALDEEISLSEYLSQVIRRDLEDSGYLK